jgi:hypothetical protein
MPTLLDDEFSVASVASVSWLSADLDQALTLGDEGFNLREQRLEPFK